MTPGPGKGIRHFKDLEVYQESFRLAMEVFRLTRRFPKEEQYALTTQMRSASRSIPANIAEGWGKRRHELVFKRQLLDAIGSDHEMLVWLDFALECEYVPHGPHGEFVQAYETLGKRLYHLLTNWKTYT